MLSKLSINILSPLVAISGKMHSWCTQSSLLAIPRTIFVIGQHKMALIFVVLSMLCHMLIFYIYIYIYIVMV